MIFKAIAGFFAGIFLFVGGIFSMHPSTATTASSTPVAQNASANAQANVQGQQHAARVAPAFASGSSSPAVAAQHQTFEVTAIPLGDGKVAASPKVGYVYSCQTSFNSGGASHDGGWIHGNTWNLDEKTQVEGKVSWDNATFSNSVSGAVRNIIGNGLPVNEPTGVFPIARTDPAWQIDRNPNSIQTQTIAYSLPANPVFAANPSCVPMGAIGVALDGVAIYNALDEAGRDAVAHEVQDLCDGHPQSAGQYHYHGPSTCMPNIDKANTVIGYALDGFPITSMYDGSGQYYTNADLDACHGTTSTYTDENGKTQRGYHYVLTQEYPYTLGCFMGTPVSLHANAPSGGQNQQSGPPQAAVDACWSKNAGDTCSFATPNGSKSGTCADTPSGMRACVSG